MDNKQIRATFEQSQANLFAADESFWYRRNEDGTYYNNQMETDWQLWQAAYNQALNDAADTCQRIGTGAMIAKDKSIPSDYLEGLVKGADDCEKAIRAKIDN